MAHGNFVEACRIFSLRCGLFVVVLGLLSSCDVLGFLSLVVAREFQKALGSVVCGTWALSLRRVSSTVVACGLSCPAACEILVPRPGIEQVSPALEGGFFTTTTRLSP